MHKGQVKGTSVTVLNYSFPGNTSNFEIQICSGQVLVIFSCNINICMVYCVNNRKAIREKQTPLQLPVGYDISPLKRVKLKILTTNRQASGQNFYFSSREWRIIFYRNPHGLQKEDLFLPLFNTNFIIQAGTTLPDRFDNMREKARDILILQRITEFSTTG